MEYGSVGGMTGAFVCGFLGVFTVWVHNDNARDFLDTTPLCIQTQQQRVRVHNGFRRKARGLVKHHMSQALMGGQVNVPDIPTLTKTVM